MEQFYRMRGVSKLLGIAKPTLYAHIVKGIWPRGIVIGPRAVAWPAPEIEAMVAARTAGKTEDQIRELVTKLIAARKNSS